MNDIKTKTVMTSNLYTLMIGICCLTGIIGLESVSIYNLITATKDTTTVTAIGCCLVQIPCLLMSCGIGNIKDYVTRKEFVIYCCKLENGVDIDYIKKEYNIVSIDDDCIIFIDRKNIDAFIAYDLCHNKLRYKDFVNNKSKLEKTGDI